MPKKTNLNEPVWKVILPRIVAGMFGVVIFISIWIFIAGRLTWWQGWAFIFSFITYSSILVWRLSKLNPELLRERNRPSDTAESWDRQVMGIYFVILVVLFIVSALDGGRFVWSAVPLSFQVIGWILLIGSGVIVWQVMMTNDYLSSWAKIQDERGQVVVQDGMYRHIRHPMYLGIILGFLGMPMVLNSWWSMIPSVIIAGLFVYRTYREDNMLIDSLVGYAEYTEKVKYRLIPGLW